MMLPENNCIKAIQALEDKPKNTIKKHIDLLLVLINIPEIMRFEAIRAFGLHLKNIIKSESQLPDILKMLHKDDHLAFEQYVKSELQGILNKAELQDSPNKSELQARHP